MGDKKSLTELGSEYARFGMRRLSLYAGPSPEDQLAALYPGRNNLIPGLENTATGALWHERPIIQRLLPLKPLVFSVTQKYVREFIDHGESTIYLMPEDIQALVNMLCQCRCNSEDVRASECVDRDVAAFEIGNPFRGVSVQTGNK